MQDLFLRRTADRRLRGGNLWVYSNEIDTDRSPLANFAPGDAVLVRTAGGQLLGSAYLDPNALICGRLYAPGEERQFDATLLGERVAAALALRRRLFDSDNYRLAYGDSDLLPGMVVDRFGDVLVLQMNNPGLERHLDAITAALLNVVNPGGLLLRADSRARREQNSDAAPQVLHGSVPERVPFTENGVHFEAPVYSGQKTGWFYDHRVSRAHLHNYVAGARVLDVYSYIGGWGVQAAVFGAGEVLCIDSSAAALDGVDNNAALNDVAARVSTMRGAAADALQQLATQGQQFDVVILDPPAFVQRRKDLKKGITAYRRINELALKLLAPNGLLVSASCSMHLSRADLMSAVQQAASRAECPLRVVEQGGQGPDHPVHPAIPETEYLKTLFAVRT
ncbi:MAG: class I SAM-dependent rRNA methyltransferase [Halioglobus sp.]|nr:class I SAM-dependent rRNA methyltransferase [Halioglobus sp.]